MTYFLPFFSKSGQFKNGKKPKISTSTILTVFQLKKWKTVFTFFENTYILGISKFLCGERRVIMVFIRKKCGFLSPKCIVDFEKTKQKKCPKKNTTLPKNP